jgi:hypothetical protein
MKIYTLQSPSITGILTDDEIYFEGIKRPSKVYMVRDVGNRETVLEQYLNDIHNLCIRKLSTFIATDTPSEEEGLKLQALVQEIVKIKGLIGGNNLNVGHH